MRDVKPTAIGSCEGDEEVSLIVERGPKLKRRRLQKVVRHKTGFRLAPGFPLPSTVRGRHEYGDTNTLRDIYNHKTYRLPWIERSISKKLARFYYNEV